MVPFLDWLLFRKEKTNTILINIGGISNITFAENRNKIISFDAGPGNYLIDKWVNKKSKMKFDRDGELAKKGTADNEILKKFLNYSYFKKKFPKSLDIKDFNLNYVNNLSLEDGCSTLSMFTVNSICLAINNFKNYPNIILFSGGGRKNKFIIENIKKKVRIPVHLIDEFNFLINTFTIKY